MEMQVDSKLIRSEREKRAWSQEHLAEAAGIGLRTIQRIEATGLASYESARALASVFEMPVSTIRIARPGKQASTRAARWRRRAAAWGAAGVACLSSVLVIRTVLAEQVMLDVDVSLNDEDRGVSRLLIDEGRDAEIRIDNVVGIVIVPTIRDDGTILLATTIYEYEDGEARLISQPRVATTDAKVAEIRQGSDSGNVYRFLITPTVQ